MRPSKIVDEVEARHLLIDEGWTYPQMVDLYRDKYEVETSVSMWSRFAQRSGGRCVGERFPLAAP